MFIYTPKVVMELQYWFMIFLQRTNLNKNQIPYPAQLKDYYFENDNSFIRLLFDDNWPTDYKTYDYMFQQCDLSTGTPKEILNRICIYPNPKIYNITYDGTYNFFQLKNDDILMLDKLLEYRTGDSTSINDITIDSTAEYETVLSNLINVYLDLKINNNYETFDDTDIISNELLTNLYEIYVIEQLFNYVSSLEIT